MNIENKYPLCYIYNWVRTKAKALVMWERRSYMLIY